MAYLNPDYIVDEDANDLYTKEIAVDPTRIGKIVELVDFAVDMYAQSNGVNVDEIPVDGSDYATTYSVIEFARLKMYIMLFNAYKGSAHGDMEDIYGMKSEAYTEQLFAHENKATRNNILGNTNLGSSDLIGSCVVY
jgi:hypothetical protein